MSLSMRQSGEKNVLIDKAAGLEFSRFSREEHRFNAISNQPIPQDNLPDNHALD